MARKFNKNIRYQKKFFNIYKDKKKIIKHKIKPLHQIKKLEYKDLNLIQMMKYEVKKSDFDIYEDVYEIFKRYKI